MLNIRCQDTPADWKLRRLGCSTGKFVANLSDFQIVHFAFIGAKIIIDG